MNKQQNSSDLLTYANAIDAIENILKLLTDKDLNSPSEIIDFLKWFILKKNKFLVYLGAGVSKNIKVKYKDGTEKYAVTQTWRQLLEQVFHEMRPIENQKKFLKSASARVGKIECLEDKSIENLTADEWDNAFKSQKNRILQELLNKLGPFRFAWSLRWFAQSSDGLASSSSRDEILSRIVNQTIDEDRDRSSSAFGQVEEYQSELLSEVVKLPFREAITTNYDHYLELFLEKDSKKRNFWGVYNNKTLIQSFQKYSTQLFYLHGKAAVEGTKYSDNLVFDKYDYAQLFTKNNQILNHLVRLFLRYGVLYVGFGLDDQTFDYMESQIKIFCEETGAKIKNIPESYAFMRSEEIAENEVEALRDLFNIKVIRFKEYSNVPEVLKHVNRMIEYIEDREIEGQCIGQKRKVEEAMEDAGKNFLNGELDESIYNYRKAIAYTLFWTIEEERDEDNWANLQMICQIYRRIILTRSKLRWSSGWHNEIQNLEININFDHTGKIIREYRERNTAMLSASNQTATEINKQLLVENVALRLLRARINYQEGKFLEAVKEFRKFIVENNQDPEYSNAVRLIREIIVQGEERKLENYEMLLLETFYFANCQFDRADKIFSNQSDYSITSAVFFEIERIHQKQSELCEPNKKNTLRLKEFGNVAVIAKWGVAISKLRDFSAFVNLKEKDKNIQNLTEIVELLEEGSTYAADNNCDPSPRWVTVKHRSKCRALGLLWFNLKEVPGKLTEASDKLTEAYRAVQDALELTSAKPALKGQHIRNLLEAVRLNLITNLPIKDSVVASNPINSAMCFAASYHYLQAAFKEIEEVLKGESETSQPYIWWVLVQAYEIACFWKMVFHKFIEADSKETGIELLDIFFEQSDMEDFVKKEYEKFSKEVLGGKNKVKGRIKSFQKVYKMAEHETGYVNRK